MLYADARRQEIGLWLIAALVFFAGAAGVLTRPMLDVRASALMIAIALVFAAAGQLQRVAPAKGTILMLAAFWRGGVLILVFAFAMRFGPFAASFGALAGMLAAAMATHALRAGGVPMTPIRWAAATLLAGTGALLAADSLRLV